MNTITFETKEYIFKTIDNINIQNIENQMFRIVNIV